MSNVVSPRGPLPPRVYWRRRLLLVAVVVGAVVLVGQLLGGGDDTRPVAERGGPTPSAKPSEPGAQDRSRSRKPAAPRARARRVTPPSTTLRGPTGPLAQPAGRCEPSEVAVVPDVQDTDAYGPVPLRVGLSTTAGQACTFAFGPDSVALRVTSGADLIWESLHCTEALRERSVVVRPGWLSYVTVDWNGRRGSEGCGDGNEYAQPGYYWAEAAAIGGEPGRSQFELQTPPEPSPKPSPKPSPQPSQQEPSDARGDRPADGEGATSGADQSGRTDRDGGDTPGTQGARQGEAAGERTGDEEPVRTRKAGG